MKFDDAPSDYYDVKQRRAQRLEAKKRQKRILRKDYDESREED